MKAPNFICCCCATYIIVLVLEKPEVVVTDVGSNYGTFIDDAVNDPTIRFESFNK